MSNKALSIGVDVGGSHIACAAVSLQRGKPFIEVIRQGGALAAHGLLDPLDGIGRLDRRLQASILQISGDVFIDATQGLRIAAAEKAGEQIKAAGSEALLVKADMAQSADLDALVDEPTNAEGWQGPYLKQGGVPLDPWGEAYVYKIPGSYNEEGYDLYSTGPDRKQGGGDDIKNWLDDDERSD